MLARTHLLRIQRSMYDRLRDYAREFLGGLGPELKRYFLEYQRDFQDFQDISSKRELLSSLQRTHIVFCGDYHTLSQAQRTVIRLLRDSMTELEKRNKETILALEMVRAADNRWIGAYLAGKLSETEFLKKISFQKNWGFSWDNYRGIFQFAKENGLRVVGLNTRGQASLYERDRFAAEIIAGLAKKYPRALTFVLMGDLHLAKAHLPRQVDLKLRKLGIKRRSLVIHQNHERFYWKLVDRGLEHLVDVVKVRPDVYCVMNTPPWVKLQSHLKWTELVSEIDYSDEIRDIVVTIGKFLKIEVEEPDDFTVYGPTNLTFLKRLEKDRVYPPKEMKILSAYVREFKSQFIPRRPSLYLATLSPNHAATVSALYLHEKLGGTASVFTNPKQQFYAFVWTEAVGFVGSKIINHKRKCNGPGDLRQVSQSTDGKDRRTKENRRVAQFVLGHLAREAELLQGRRRTLSGVSLPATPSSARRTIFYYKAAKLLGHLLGQALYTAVVEERIDRKALLLLYQTAFDKLSPSQSRDLYTQWIRRLDGFGYRYVTKSEKL